MPRGNGRTRQEILDSIKRNGAMTAEELAQILGISQVAVRQHLASLEAEDVVTVTIERRGLGRPAHRYGLTRAGDESFPREYDRLANSLIEEIRSWLGEPGVMEVAARRRQRTLSLLMLHTAGEPVMIRAQELAKRLTDLGFMAELHLNEDGDVVLIKRNCPIYQVALNHPELCCQGDCAAYSQALGVHVVQERSILDGHHACEIRITDIPAIESDDDMDSDTLHEAGLRGSERILAACGDRYGGS
jgi:predicted ArsR family transcriptional regulator